MSREILHKNIQTLNGFFLISWLQFLRKLESLSVGITTDTSRFLDQVQHSSSILEITSIGNNIKMALTASVSNSVCFCKGLHPTYNCNVVTDYQKRLDIVKDNTFCFNCLAPHRVSQCPSKFHCRKCKKKHHTSLCNSETTNTSEVVSDEQKTEVTTPTSGLLTPALHCKASENNTTCLLKTAVALIIAGGIRTQANIYTLR